MSDTDFTEAMVGDRVYTLLLSSKNPNDKTNATIVAIGIKQDTPYPVIIRPDIAGTGESMLHFGIAGEYFKEGGQVLFWSKPEFEVPVRPKRLVKKKVWLGYNPEVNVTHEKSTQMQWHTTSCLYYVKEQPILQAGLLDRSYKLLEVEIEVEE